MTPAARIQTAAELLDVILDGDPAEKVLTRWARSSRFAGSKDRAAVRDHVFEALRCKRSLAALGGAMTGRGVMIGLMRHRGEDLSALFSGAQYAPAALTADEAAAGCAPGSEAADLDLPDWLLAPLHKALGEALPTNAQAMKARAPVILRANLRKANRAQARARLTEDGIETCDHPLTDAAIEVLNGGRRVAQSSTYRDGWVEIQDASSQAAVDCLNLTDGMRVLEYCAGGGGKLLAIGSKVDGAFFAHDLDRKRMADLPARADRAGLQVQVLDKPDFADQAPFDLVFCDVPCSGSGTWRRTPDAKWRFTPDRLVELTDIQDQILQDASQLVAPGGVLAYATCSLLNEENEQRIEAFLSANPGWSCSFRRRWDLTMGGDGFFTAHLTAS